MIRPKRDNVLPTRVLENMTTAVVVVDQIARVRYLNPAAQVLLGVSERQAIGAALSQLNPGTASLEEAVMASVNNGQPFTERERRLELVAGAPITIDCALTPLTEGGALLEITELDRRLRIAREHHLLSQHHATRELIRGLAHEIKNPLGGLRGAAQLLDRELSDPEQQEYTRVIIEEADRLRALVNGLLGPHGRPHKRQVNIHEIVERVRQLVEAEAPPGVSIERDYDPSIPSMWAEPNQLIQAVLNIVRNALQALGDQGRITLRTRTQRQFTIGDTTHKLVIRLEVIDTGPGISPDQIDRIFYPMVTSRVDGTGLGLSIAQTLVNQHNGLIECVSEPGNTVFTIWLPLESEDD